MTMSIQITNTDQTRTAKVSVQDFNIDRRTIACVDYFALAPGEGRTVHIHAARQVLVNEDPLAERVPAPRDDEEAVLLRGLKRAQSAYDAVMDNCGDRREAWNHAREAFAPRRLHLNSEDAR